MNRTAEVITAPHTHSTTDVQQLMMWVCLSLVPATAFSILLFGWPALWLLLTTSLTVIVCEWGCLRLAKGSSERLMDGSALLTGWLLVLSLPAWAPWWLGVLGGAFAIIVCKHVYGGLGQNLFNPAMAARTALLITFPIPMTQWPLSSFSSHHWPSITESLTITFGGALPDGTTGATPLGGFKTALSHGAATPEQWFHPIANVLGTTGGSMGETSALLLFLGGMVLLWRRIITWQVPCSMLITLAILALLAHQFSPERYPDALAQLLSGGAILGAFYIATDPVTSPNSGHGQLIYGAGIGSLVFIIRSWGNYPEAVAFAVLLMNAMTPLIDHYIKPRVYGHPVWWAQLFGRRR